MSSLPAPDHRRTTAGIGDNSPPASPPAAPLADPIDPLVDAVAAQFGVTARALRHAVNDGRAVEARRLAAALALRRLRIPLRDVSDYFGLVDAAVNTAAHRLDILSVDFTLSRHSPLSELIAFVFRHWLGSGPALGGYHSVAEIQDATCTAFDVSKADMLSPRRARPLATARQVAMALSKHLTRRSFPEIGRRFNRDHTTVLHAVRQRQLLIDALARSVPPDAPLAEWLAKAKLFLDRDVHALTKDVARSGTS